MTVKEAEIAEAAARLAYEDGLRAKARALLGPGATLPQVTALFQKMIADGENA